MFNGIWHAASMDLRCLKIIIVKPHFEHTCAYAKERWNTAGHDGSMPNADQYQSMQDKISDIDPKCRITLLIFIGIDRH